MQKLELSNGIHVLILNLSTWIFFSLIHHLPNQTPVPMTYQIPGDPSGLQENESPVFWTGRLGVTGKNIISSSLGLPEGLKRTTGASFFCRPNGIQTIHNKLTVP
jgi:hypothetical protein